MAFCNFCFVCVNLLLAIMFTKKPDVFFILLIIHFVIEVYLYINMCTFMCIFNVLFPPYCQLSLLICRTANRDRQSRSTTTPVAQDSEMNLFCKKNT